MKPVLVVMAAGMGSRYGGLKQIDKIGPNGEVILELSVYDAIIAGFESVVFILRKEIIEEFKELVGNKLSQFVEVNYVIQDLNNIPKEYSVPAGRKKPWGTAHAILCTRDVVKSPFVVINADDFYGRQAFELMYDFLSNNSDENNHSMIGYKLCNTLSEHGHVARGICEVEDGYLKGVVERIKIIKQGDKALFTEDEITWTEIDYEGIVSMNMWGFMPSIFNEIEIEFKNFFSCEVKNNPLKSECYIPTVVGKLLNSKKAKVKVMKSRDKWYGVTYQEDKELVKEAIEKMINEGLYSRKLWEGINR